MLLLAQIMCLTSFLSNLCLKYSGHLPADLSMFTIGHLLQTHFYVNAPMATLENLGLTYNIGNHLCGYPPLRENDLAKPGNVKISWVC